MNKKKYTARGLERCFYEWLDARRVSVPLVVKPSEGGQGIACVDGEGEPVCVYLYSEAEMPTHVQFLIDAGISDAEFESYKKDDKMAPVCRCILREFENIYQKRCLSGGRGQDMAKQLLQDCQEALSSLAAAEPPISMQERAAIIREAFEAMEEDGVGCSCKQLQ